MKKALVVTGCDEAHFELADDMLASFRFHYKDRLEIAFVCFGDKLPPPQIKTRVNHFIQVNENYQSFDRSLGYYAAYASIKPRIPEFFPGYEMYCWVDADCWFANAESLPRIFFGAQQTEISMHPELDVHYQRFQIITERTRMIYRKNEGDRIDRMPLDMPMLNGGVFAMRSGSRVWKLWDNELRTLLKRHEAGEDVHFSDQIPLHKLIYTTDINVYPLRALDNWLVNISRPIVHRETKSMRVPTAPYEAIGLIHFAGPKAIVPFVDQTGQKHSLRYRDIRRYFDKP